MTIDVAAVQAALPDIEGIEGLTLTNIGGRMVFGWNSFVAAVDPSSDLDAIVATIRKAVAVRESAPPVTNAPQIATPMPAQAAPANQPSQGKTMSTPVRGSFAAALRNMMDDARAGLDEARAAGIAEVQSAVDELHEVKEATKRVTGNMAQTIKDEAASVRAELGQISNDLG